MREPRARSCGSPRARCAVNRSSGPERVAPSPRTPGLRTPDRLHPALAVRPDRDALLPRGRIAIEARGGPVVVVGGLAAEGGLNLAVDDLRLGQDRPQALVVALALPAGDHQRGGAVADRVRE